MRWATLGFLGILGCSGSGFEVGESDAAGDSAVVDSAALDSSSVDSSSIDSGDPIDTSVRDSGLLDSGTVDTGLVDTGVKDTGVLDTGTLDTGPFDSGTFDSGTFDSGTFDSGPFDSGTFDSGPFDSGTFDSGTFDTGLDTGDGAVCPRPKSTVTIDVSTLTCDDLKLKYPTTLPEARKCVCDADCSVTVAKDFCGCTVNASPANDAHVSLIQMQKRWTALGCTVFCPGIPCIEPPAAKCLFDVSGGPGRCN